MEEFKVNILEHNINGNVDSTNKISKIDIAILNLNEKLAQQRNKLCESKTFVSRSKWFEYGEKSNKFF
jgi:hypothetical protein